VQTTYYLVTAIWPLVHIDSFMWVTGPKSDIWLVKTVAALLAAISFYFLYMLLTNQIEKNLAVLAMGCCIVLTAIDCYYVFTETISMVYLLDAGLELLLLVAWVLVLMFKTKNPR
jgi:hypothetical protein